MGIKTILRNILEFIERGQMARVRRELIALGYTPDKIGEYHKSYLGNRTHVPTSNKPKSSRNDDGITDIR